MIQLGIRFHDTKAVPFEERVQSVRDQGFDCVHMALSKMGDIPCGPGMLTPGYAAHMKRIFDREEVDVAVLGCYLNLAHPDENELKRIQSTYREHLRFASLLGCGVVGTETGAPNADYAYDKEACHSDWALELFMKNLEPVVRDAEKAGVILAIEPVYTHIVSNPARARKVLDSIGSPNLQIIFDPVNLLHTDNLAFRQDVIEEAIDLLGRDIAIIHLKDYGVEEGRIKSMACGTGVMDYSRIIRFAKEEKPYIHATLEDTVPDNAVAAQQFIRELEQIL